MEIHLPTTTTTKLYRCEFMSKSSKLTVVVSLEVMKSSHEGKHILAAEVLYINIIYLY